MALSRALASWHSAVIVMGPPGGAAQASGHPSASTMTEPSTHATPRPPPAPALLAGPVARRDEHAVDGRVGLDPHDLGRPLTVRPRERRPVGRGAQQLCAV